MVVPPAPDASFQASASSSSSSSSHNRCMDRVSRHCCSNSITRRVNHSHTNNRKVHVTYTRYIRRVIRHLERITQRMIPRLRETFDLKFHSIAKTAHCTYIHRWRFSVDENCWELNISRAPLPHLTREFRAIRTWFRSNTFHIRHSSYSTAARITHLKKLIFERKRRASTRSARARARAISRFAIVSTSRIKTIIRAAFSAFNIFTVVFAYVQFQIDSKRTR